MKIHKSWSANSSGQTLLMAVLLGLMLLVGVTAVVFMNQMGTKDQMSADARTKGASVAIEGLAYATQTLSASTTLWENARNGIIPNSACPSGDIQSPSGGHFSLYCSTGTTGNFKLQNYQVSVISVASIKGTGAIPTPVRATKAYLSKRTLGVDLASGIHAAAAVQLNNTPANTGTLNVHWGPVVLLDTATWVLGDPIDSSRYPRKFSAGGITGSGSLTRSGTYYAGGLLTDQNEYWAFAPQGTSPIVDEAYYIGLATAATGVPATNVLASSCYPVANTTCGYFDAAGAGPGTTANFTGSYTVPAALNNVIYVNGNASFTDIKMDNAVVIVTGNLTINASAVGNNLLLHVPSSAASEYPYYGQGLPAIIPCNNNIGDTLGSGAPNYDCNSTTVFGGSTFQFRGFLYVKGDLIVSPGVTWTMAGTLLVGDPMIVPGTGGKLKIATGSTLNVAYDDIINHSIAMSPMNGTAIKIAPDLIQDVPAF